MGGQLVRLLLLHHSKKAQEQAVTFTDMCDPTGGPFQMSPRGRPSDAEDANEAQEVHIYKPALEGSPQMTEMNAQEKLLLKQLGQRFQLASERKAAAIVWDAPAMRHLNGEALEILDPEHELSEGLSANPLASTSAVVPIVPNSPEEVPATFYRLDFGDSPSVQQQMPEALRKRLENRKEQREREQKKSEKVDKKTESVP